MDTPKFYFSSAPTHLLVLFIPAVLPCIVGDSSPKRKQPWDIFGNRFHLPMSLLSSKLHREKIYTWWINSAP